MKQLSTIRNSRDDLSAKINSAKCMLFSPMSLSSLLRSLVCSPSLGLMSSLLHHLSLALLTFGSDILWTFSTFDVRETLQFRAVGNKL